MNQFAAIGWRADVQTGPGSEIGPLKRVTEIVGHPFLWTFFFPVLPLPLLP